jgi:hypothetical protein
VMIAIGITTLSSAQDAVPCIDYPYPHTTGFLAFVPQLPLPGTIGEKIIYELSAVANGPRFPEDLANNNFTMDMFLEQNFVLQSHQEEGSIWGEYVVGFYDADYLPIRLYYLSGFDTCTGYISDEELQRFARIGLFVLPDVDPEEPQGQN